MKNWILNFFSIIEVYNITAYKNLASGATENQIKLFFTEYYNNVFINEDLYFLYSIHNGYIEEGKFNYKPIFPYAYMLSISYISSTIDSFNAADIKCFNNDSFLPFINSELHGFIVLNIDEYNKNGLNSSLYSNKAIHSINNSNYVQIFDNFNSFIDFIQTGYQNNIFQNLESDNNYVADIYKIGRKTNPKSPYWK